MRDNRGKNSRNTGKNKGFGNRDFNKGNDRRFDGRTENRFNKYNDRKENDTFDENLQLEGRNPVLEAINSGKTIDKIIVKKGEIEGTLRVIVAKAVERGIIVQEVDKNKMAEISRSNNCQGVIALCPAHEYADVSDIIQAAKDKGEDPFIIVLDEITDPHNLGAILRTADASGAHGVIIPKRRAVGLTAIVSKTSAGAVEHVPVARVTNIAKTVEDLKKQGIWVACADMEGQEYFDAPLNGPIALVIGSEGSGVSRLVKQKCDFAVKIPMFGKISSLNASVAAGLIMYEVVRQRNKR